MSAARRRPALPAKLSPPRLHGVVARPRLFAWLDEAAAPLAWIEGAPGAGKTTLVASWAASRRPTLLWYRLDSDDLDLGRVYAALALAARAAGSRARLPAFAAEHLAQPPRFARRWFRALAAALPPPAVLVFDNLEQAPLGALPGVLAAAAAEAAPGLRVIVTARHAPPAALAPALVAGAARVLPAEALAFSPAETDAYAQALQLDTATVRRAAARVRGWAAGLRLLGGHGSPVAPDAAPQLLFDYVAGLLDAQLDADAQDLLLVAALLPHAQAEVVDQVAGRAGSAALFEGLCLQHLFIERVDGAADTWRLHPLLAQFLRDRMARRWPAPLRRARLRAAALAMAGRGDTDAAIGLALDAGETGLAAAWLRDSLEGRLAAGQLDQIASWCSRLGDAVLDAEPALRYGLARACFLREDPAALDHYARAADAFAARGDAIGRQLCAAGLLETAYNQDSFLDHARWSALLLQPRPAQREPADERHRLRLLNGRLLACFYLGDFPAHAQASIEQVLALLATPDAAADKLCAAVTLLGLLERHKRWDAAALLAGRMEALLEAPGVGPRLAILVRQQIAADLHRQTGAYDEARRMARTARAQAHEQGFAVLEYEAVAIGLLAALYQGEAAEARTLLADLAALGRPGNVYHQRFAAAMHCWHEAQAGRLAAAQEHAAALRAAVERSDMPPRFRATWLLHAVLARFAGGDEPGACAELEAACTAAEPGSRETLVINLLGLRAVRALRAGDDAAAAALAAQAFEAGAPLRYHQLLAPLRDELSRLAALVLRRDGPAATFAHELVRRRRLVPPSPAAAPWPWALRIHTFGRFAIEVDGEPLRFAGKAPRKPLALLKALIALGPAPVAEVTLVDRLWPDEPADAAHDALAVALHRLRRLLPDGAELVTLSDGHLALRADRVWVDARAFEHLSAQAERGGADALPAMRAALALYAGHFLAGDGGEAWCVAARERLRARCRRTVAAGAQWLVDAGRADEALDLWRRGLEIDELDEAFTQGAMACCLRLGRAAEGLAAYQRCRRVLSLALGIAPSAATEALAARLRAAA